MCAEFHEWYIAITTVVNQANANSANVHLQRKRKRSHESAEWWFFSCSAECCAHFTAYLLLDMATWNHSLWFNTIVRMPPCIWHWVQPQCCTRLIHLIYKPIKWIALWKLSETVCMDSPIIFEALGFCPGLLSLRLSWAVTRLQVHWNTALSELWKTKMDRYRVRSIDLLPK